MVEVVSLATRNVQDIPTLMENAAKELRDDAVKPRNAVCVVVDEDGGVAVFGWGADAFGFYAVGLLQAGMNDIIERGYSGG